MAISIDLLIGQSHSFDVGINLARVIIRHTQSLTVGSICLARCKFLSQSQIDELGKNDT